MHNFVENSWTTNIWRIRLNFVDFLTKEKWDEEEFFANALLVNEFISKIFLNNRFSNFFQIKGII